MLPCLYCAGSQHCRTDEHVLQAGFNTNWVLHEDVCGPCNSAFSRHDTELVRFVRSVTHANNPAVNPRISILQGHAIIQDPESKLWLSVRINAKGEPTTFDQILLSADGRVLPIFGNPSSWERSFAAVTAELRTPAKLKLETKVIEHPPVDTAVVRSAPFKYLIVARSQEEIEKAKEIINSGDLGNMGVNRENPGEPRSIERPQAQLRHSYDMASVRAALVKTAVNFVCATIGPDIARGPELRAAREYALNSQGSKGEKFVRLEFGDQAATGLRRLSKAGHHTLALIGLPGATLVAILLYEEPLAIVSLANEPVLSIEDSRFAFLDYVSGQHEVNIARDNAFFRELSNHALSW